MSGMKLRLWRNEATGVFHFEGSYHEGDLARCQFSQFDFALLRDCDPTTPGRTVADALLALELIARRLEEASAAEPVGQQEPQP